ncbi:MAG: hypothetical protein ABJB40_12905 [Acidobacteriota bacterium]
MADFKIVYLIIERGLDPNRQTLWRSAGIAFVCRDGSLNVKLDVHPGLTFNIRDPKSVWECEQVVQTVEAMPSEAVNGDMST